MDYKCVIISYYLHIQFYITYCNMMSYNIIRIRIFVLSLNTHDIIYILYANMHIVIYLTNYYNGMNIKINK